MGHVKNPKLLVLTNDEDVRINRLASIERDIEEDPDFLLEVMMSLINFSKKQHHTGVELNLYRFEARLEEANFWLEKWLSENETDSDN